MCLEVNIKCFCGKKEVAFSLRDGILTPEVILNVYCPECSKEVAFSSETMLRDRNWIIEYDIEIARFLLTGKRGISPYKVTPEFVFDEGYAAWKETYPGELKEIEGEKAKIVKLLEEDPKLYFQAIKEWAIARANKLKAEGWRKAQKM